MERRLLLAVLLAVVLAVGVSAAGIEGPIEPAQAHGTVDPIAQAIAATVAQDCSGGCGQTFVANQSNIVGFDFGICGNSSCGSAGTNSPGNQASFVLRVFGNPTPLATTGVISMKTDGTSTHIDWPSQVTLVLGTKYEIAAVIPSGQPSLYQASGGSSYAGGAVVRDGSETPPWDLAFKIYYNPAPVIQPTTIGIVRNGLWYLNSQNDGSAQDFTFNYGATTDVAIAGDWDCSGSVTPGVFRNGAFYLSNAKNGSGPHHAFFYGAAGDVPIVGDWDGNGCDSVGIFRGGWFFMTNAVMGSPAVHYSFFFGAPDDKPVTGDWDGNGSDSVGIFRNGGWYLTNATSGSPSPNYTFAFGASSDIPVTGDWDANGSRSVGIFRNGVWYLTNAVTGSPGVDLAFAFGATGDKPVTGAWGAAASSAVVGPAQATVVPACAQTFSCLPGLNDWTGPVGGTPPAPQGAWTGPSTPLAPGWTGIGETLSTLNRPMATVPNRPAMQPQPYLPMQPQFVPPRVQPMPLQPASPAPSSVVPAPAVSVPAALPRLRPPSTGDAGLR